LWRGFIVAVRVSYHRQLRTQSCESDLATNRVKNRAQNTLALPQSITWRDLCISSGLGAPAGTGKLALPRHPLRVLHVSNRSVLLIADLKMQPQGPNATRVRRSACRKTNNLTAPLLVRNRLPRERPPEKQISDGCMHTCFCSSKSGGLYTKPVSIAFASPRSLWG
jgi:hypothetical protein